MSRSVKIPVYSFVLLLYLAVMIALPANFFAILIIVPFIASGWALTVLILFIKNWKKLKDDMDSDKVSNWKSDSEYIAKWESEPKDIEWKFHTAIIILWTVYYFSSIIISLILR